MDSSCDRFIRFLATERGLSDAYQASVRQTLDALAKWMQVPLRDLGTDELAAFLLARKTEALNAASLRITTVHLKIFFRWLVAGGALEMDPAEPLLAPRPDSTLPETLHAEELVKLLESIDPAQPLGRRDLAILELFYSSGLRLSELCKARLETLDSDEGFLRVTGKGGKTRIVRVGRKALAAISDYLANERPALVTKKPRRTFSSASAAARSRRTGCGRSSRSGRNSQASTRTFIPTYCATRSPRTSLKAERIYG